MELLAGWPEWLVWCVAGTCGVLALAVVGNMIDAVLDAERQALVAAIHRG